ncbi:hypothetical protein OMP38_06770 [Cohnella ginsengisoli]|uniref:Uncharacterized protein n=1 Tax=Cohnella ginsengisoli TaxID=425004 RepID=A0A9X4KIX9_9BACL|nr:hypothetical protein [Cohnella ginsengisoli]MDG0790590.1 hypothetical protein [Cohnella ginsengisoli]
MRGSNDRRVAAATKATGKAAEYWRREGAVDGAAWRSAHPAGTVRALSDYAQRAWADKVSRQAAAGSADRLRLYRYGAAYAAGIRQGSGMQMHDELLPLQGSASAVLYADGSTASLQAVLAELERLPLREIVVVLGANAEPMLKTLLSHPRVVVFHSPDGYKSPHAARAAGAKLTGADSVLFADGAKPCPARLLGAMLVRADAGTDAVLCDRTTQEGAFDRRGRRFLAAGISQCFSW